MQISLHIDPNLTMRKTPKHTWLKLKLNVLSEIRCTNSFNLVPFPLKGEDYDVDDGLAHDDHDQAGS